MLRIFIDPYKLGAYRSKNLSPIRCTKVQPNSLPVIKRNTVSLEAWASGSDKYKEDGSLAFLTPLSITVPIPPKLDIISKLGHGRIRIWGS